MVLDHKELIPNTTLKKAIEEYNQKVFPELIEDRIEKKKLEE